MRQSYVLKRLHTTGKITDDEYRESLKEKIKIRLKRGSKTKGGHFTDWVRQRLFEKLGKEKFLTGGFEVVTTINWDLQKVAEEQVLGGIQKVDKRQGFKGPLKNLDRNQFVDYYKKQRINTYSKNSKYFVFDTDGINKDEISFSETEIENILENRQKSLDEVDRKRRKKIISGVLVDDPLVSFLKENMAVKVLVEEVNDAQRIVYASFGGVPVVIPYDGFKWAHERVINEEKKYFPYVKEPSSILKRGDIVLAKIVSKPSSIKKFFNKAYSLKLKKNKKLDKFYNNQKYFVADLDQESNVEGALLSIDPNTGYVLSMVGGANFDKSQFNRVIQSNRQPGSSFKPFIFASSLENGFTPSSLLLDSPSALGGANQALDWKPRNYDGKFKGEMTLRRSLEVSRNIPTIKLVQDVGVDKVIEFSKRVGIDSEMPQDLSISLGSFGINLEKLVKAYSIFPNGGRRVNLKAILSVKDRFGKVYIIDENKQLVEETKDEVKEKEEVLSNTEVASIKKDTKESEEQEEKVNEFLVNLVGDQVYDKRLAFLMTNLLKGVIQSGTGARAKRVSSFIGGKTGTTNNYVDAWFMGFSRNIVTGVWVGHDDNKTLGWPETGSKSALPIWAGYMKKAIQKYGESDFEVPAGIVNVAINKETGKPLSIGDNGVFLESFVEGTEPGVNDEEKKS